MPTKRFIKIQAKNVSTDSMLYIFKPMMYCVIPRTNDMTPKMKIILIFFVKEPLLIIRNPVLGLMNSPRRQFSCTVVRKSVSLWWKKNLYKFFSFFLIIFSIFVLAIREGDFFKQKSFCCVSRGERWYCCVLHIVFVLLRTSQCSLE